jgi:beta-galactosidase
MAAAEPRPWGPLLSSVTATGATAQDGRRVRFLHNWSWQKTAVTLPVAMRDVLSGTGYELGTHIQLSPWDVRVLLEA